ncbi:MAG: glucose-6-phosphate isomerase [Rhodopirellula sp.]|nr:glucose-6-phosphate isomerase [Rhodopirellula sp.]
MASDDNTRNALEYDPSGVMMPETGLSRADLDWIAPRLEAARAEVLADLDCWHRGDPVPEEKQPLDAGFTDLPDRLLDEHAQAGEQSELGRMIAVAKRLRETVDRAVILGIGGSYMGARAMFEACCHPFHNEMPRVARDDHPRIYFEGNNADNAAMLGLMDLLTTEHAADDWAIVVISKSGGTLETAVAFRLFLDVLRQACGGDIEKVRQRVVPITGRSGRLRDLAHALGSPEVFDIPEGVGGRFSVLSAVGLLPAAVMGLDVVKLLQGAAEMNRRFREQSPGSNPVLDYVAVCHLMESRRGANVRVLSTWGKGLESVGLWYDQLLAESLGKDGQGALPLTVVNTRDLHSRGQQHQEGARDKLITNLVGQRYHPGVLTIERSDLNQDRLNDLAGTAVPEILEAAFRGTNQAYHDDRRPTADIRLEPLDEAALGQFFQMMMLATAVEGRLIGINPYGQPGVEAYKKNMTAILRGK